MSDQTKKLEKKAKFLNEKEASLKIEKHMIERVKFQVSSLETECHHCEVKLKSQEELKIQVKAYHSE